MHQFRCVNCGRDSYSASPHPTKACEFCGGRLEIVEEPADDAPPDED